jgi:thiosulfate/3-mercaptopyruvate sulfurtransferase
MTYTPVIQAKELAAIFQNEDLVIIDASAGPNTKSAYDAKHLAGAWYADLNKQLADIKEDAANGGRHPLPSAKQFAETLTGMGISNESHIVIYDDKNGSNAAARLWWMLRSLGHEKVQVLNGGIQAAEKEGLPMNADVPVAKKTAAYTATDWLLPQVDMEEAGRKAKDENSILVDVRDAYRYNGESEPIDLVAGHIPGAINIPFSENLDENGLFLSPSILKEKYEQAFKNIPSQDIAVHCGSGVTACHTLLAISYAGLPIPALYVGSWSEWSRNKPVADRS